MLEYSRFEFLNLIKHGLLTWGQMRLEMLGVSDPEIVPRKTLEKAFGIYLHDIGGQNYANLELMWSIIDEPSIQALNRANMNRVTRPLHIVLVDGPEVQWKYLTDQQKSELGKGLKLRLTGKDFLDSSAGERLGFFTSNIGFGITKNAYILVALDGANQPGLKWDDFRVRVVPTARTLLHEYYHFTGVFDHNKVRNALNEHFERAESKFLESGDKSGYFFRILTPGGIYYC